MVKVKLCNLHSDPLDQIQQGRSHLDPSKKLRTSLETDCKSAYSDERIDSWLQLLLASGLEEVHKA